MSFERLSGIASILGLLATIGAYFSPGYPIHTWLLAFMAIIFLTICIYSCHKYKTANHYLDGEAVIRDLHNKFIQDLPQVKSKSFEGIIHQLSNYCSKISDAFKSIKGVEVGVCIKYTNGQYSNPYIKTLCRDAHSNNERQDYDESNDYINQNTDFSHIFKLVSEHKKFKDLYYCGNRLANQHQYNNSHLDSSNLPSGLFSYYQRRKKWPLPYRSSLVVPYMSADGKCIDAFLCIDSPNSNGFNE